MRVRTLDNLILENKDYCFKGDLDINGDINIKNGSLIVSGILHFSGKFSVTGGDVSCGRLINHSSFPIVIRDGDICVKKDLTTSFIDSDGDIRVGGDAKVFDGIKCLNYIVSGYNTSGSIAAMQDVYISYDNRSRRISARDILICGHSDSEKIEARGEVVIGGTCNLNYNAIIAKKFYCERVTARSSMAIG